MKLCTTCNCVKPYAEMVKHSGRKDGYSSICKDCNSAKYKIRYADNKEIILARNADYQNRNADRLKEQKRDYYVRTKEKRQPKRKEYSAKRYAEKGAIIRAVNQEWRDANRDRHRELSSQWQRANASVVNAATARRRARKARATPTWADDAKIREFYFAAHFLGMVTGEWHHVDHIVPLRGNGVCGLHVEHNLQVITGRENQSKSNRHWPDMPGA